MCGIAGYSLEPESSVDRTLAAQALLAGIAERGADAVGYAHRGAAAQVARARSCAAARARCSTSSHVPPDATQALIHVRDYTKGHPDDRGEQPPDPPRHGRRASTTGSSSTTTSSSPATASSAPSREMTVDSEAIFALVEQRAARRRGRSSELRGAMAAAWLDERDAATLYLARGVGRPLWLGTRPATSSSSPRRGARSRSSSATLRPTLRSARSTKDAAARRRRPRRRASDRFRPDRRYREDELPARRPRAARGRLVPRAPRASLASVSA